MRIVESNPQSLGDEMDQPSSREVIVDGDTLQCFQQFLLHLRRERRFFSRLVTAQNKEPGARWSLNLRSESQIGQVVCQIIRGSTDIDDLASRCGADKELLEQVVVLWKQLKQQINKELIGQIHISRRKMYLSSDHAA